MFIPRSSLVSLVSLFLSSWYCFSLAYDARTWALCVDGAVPAAVQQRCSNRHQSPSGEAGLNMLHGQLHRGSLKQPMCHISSRLVPMGLLHSLTRRLLLGPSRPGVRRDCIHQSHWRLHQTHKNRLPKSFNMSSSKPQEAICNKGENCEGLGVCEASIQDTASAHPISPTSSKAAPTRGQASYPSLTKEEKAALSCEEGTPHCTSMVCATHWDRFGRAIVTDRPPRKGTPRGGSLTPSLPRSRSRSPTNSLVSIETRRYRDDDQESLSSTARMVINRIHTKTSNYHRELKAQLEEDSLVVNKRVTDMYQSGFRQGVFAVRNQHDTNVLPRLLAPSFISGFTAGLLGIILGVLLGMLLKTW